MLPSCLSFEHMRAWSAGVLQKASGFFDFKLERQPGMAQQSSAQSASPAKTVECSLFVPLVDRLLQVKKGARVCVLAPALAEFGLPGLPRTPNWEIIPLPAGERSLEAMTGALEAHSPERLLLVADWRNSWPASENHELSFEEEALSLALQSMRPGARLVALLPEPFGKKPESAAGRRVAFSTVPMAALVTWEPQPTLANCLFGPLYRGQRGHLWLFQQGRNPSQPVHFLRVTESAPAVVDELNELLRNKAVPGGYWSKLEVEAGEPVYHERFEKQVESRRAAFATFGAACPLRDLADIFRGSVTAGLSAREEDAQPVLESAHLVSGEVQLDAAKYARPAPQASLQEGDLCFSAYLNPHEVQLLVAEVKPDDLPLLAGDTILVVRPRHLDEHQMRILRIFLRSRHLGESVRARGATTGLTVELLSSVQIPAPDPVLATALQSLGEAAERFARWQSEAQDAIEMLFGSLDQVGARQTVLQAGRLTRHRCEAGEAVEQMTHRIRTRYPHPLALRWRAVESAQADERGLRRLLECFEATVVYVSLVGTCIARSLGIEPGYLATIRKNFFDKPSHGLSLGDWLAILQNLGEQQDLLEREDLPLFELFQVLRSPEFRQVPTELAHVRNDLSHGRQPEHLVPSVFESRLPQLESWLGSLECLSEYPLRFIERTFRDSLKRVTRYDYRDLMGDHPLVPLAQGTSDSGELEARSLYLVDRGGDHHLLRPWLTRYPNDKGEWGTYHLEKHVGGHCVLKSLELGDSLSSQELTEAFQCVGLVRPS